MERVLSLLGIGVLVGIAWLLSTHRRRVDMRVVAWGLGLQFVFGLILFIPALRDTAFLVIDRGVHQLLDFSNQGADFVFQTIEPHQITTVDLSGVKPPKPELFMGHISPPLKTIAFWVLPTVIFFSAILTVLYHYGVMQAIVRFFAWIMQATLGTSGAESLSAAANIFVGQTEAPLMVRPYVARMTQSELHAVMVGGFATIAGGVLALYVGFLGHIDGIAGHLVTASIMSAPAALVCAKLMLPETETPQTLGRVRVEYEKIDANGVEALTRGTLDGLRLAANIAAMLLVFVAVVALLNWTLGVVGSWFDVTLSLQRILGWLFAPLAAAMGIPLEEAPLVGSLLGEKLVLTELYAYQHLSRVHVGELSVLGTVDLAGARDAVVVMPEVLSQRSAVIASYALCGFANFASIGIQIGGIGGIAPERRADLARLGFRAMIGGTLAAMMTGAVAGVLY